MKRASKVLNSKKFAKKNSGGGGEMGGGGGGRRVAACMDLPHALFIIQWDIPSSLQFVYIVLTTLKIS